MIHFMINTYDRFTTVYNGDSPCGTITAPLMTPRRDVENSDKWTIANIHGDIVWARKYRPPFSIVKALLA
jgi:hypothetical protein